MEYAVLLWFQIYLLDIILWYAVFSAILGGILGATDHLGEVSCAKNQIPSFLFFSSYLLLYLLSNIYFILICCSQRRDNTSY